MVIISIDYDEGNQDSYKGVITKKSDDIVLSAQNKTTKKFYCGCPDVDFLSAMLYCRKVLKDTDIMLASSCDHFTQDGENWGWASTIIGEIIVDLAVIDSWALEPHYLTANFVKELGY